MSAETDTDRAAAARGARPPRFVDELISPIVCAAVAVIAILQLIERPPRHLPVLVWVLVAGCVIGVVVMAVPRHRLPVRVRAVLVSEFAVSGAVLFALAPSTAAVAFVFLAATTAGERLDSRRTALTVSLVSVVVTAASIWVADTWLHVAGESQYWLSLLVGLPVYVGIARRERSDAIVVAEFAAEQSRRAAASEAREAALEERGRIAREIHDVLGHALSGIAVQLDMADALYASGRGDEASEAVRRARALAVSGIGETRRAINALREDTLPLPETLARLADGGGSGCRVAGEPGQVPVAVAQAVIRAAQEAITNAHRHAPGSKVDLLLEYEDGSVRLTVTDTGATGALAAESPSTGMGLVGMRERAGLLGGTLSAGPVDPPSVGWQVRLELPR